MSDKEFMEWCELPHDYETFEDYMSDVRRWLTLSSWKYSGNLLDYVMDVHLWQIVEGYARGDTIGDTGAEAGFFCG